MMESRLFRRVLFAVAAVALWMNLHLPETGEVRFGCAPESTKQRGAVLYMAW